jgi:hypothetical protein
MKVLLILFLIISIDFHSFSQKQGIEGKWYVENKTSPSDLDIPTEFILIKDSSAFNSKSMVDSMYCSEYFIFEPDSNFNCIGECHAYDPKNNWFSFYGSYGMWELKNKTTLKLDYVHGYHITHCEFKIRRLRNRLVLKRTKKETVEIKLEKELEEYNK